jgi:hypothetical protein
VPNYLQRLNEINDFYFAWGCSSENGGSRVEKVRMTAAGFAGGAFSRVRGAASVGPCCAALLPPNHCHDPSAFRRGRAARSSAAGEPRAAESSGAPAPGKRAAPAPGKRAVPGSPIGADRTPSGTERPRRGREPGVPRFCRICRGQAVRVGGSGIRPPAHLQTPSAGRMNRRRGCAD